MSWGTSGRPEIANAEVAKNTRQVSQLLCDLKALQKETNLILETGASSASTTARLVKVIDTGVWTSPPNIKALTLTIEEGTVSFNDSTTLTTITLVPVSFSWDFTSLSNTITITGLSVGTIFYVSYLI